MSRGLGDVYKRQIIGALHVVLILIKRILRQGIAGIAIRLIGLKKMEQMLGYNYQRINMNDRRKDSINY